MAKDIRKAFKQGAWVTAAVLVTTYLLSLIGFEVTELFAISPATGITPTIGMKLIETLQGIISFEPLSILYIWISASVIVLVGSFLFGMIKAPKFGGSAGRLMSELLLGTAAFYVILIGMAMPAVETFIGLVVYYAIVALSLNLGFLKKQAKKLKVL